MFLLIRLQDLHVRVHGPESVDDQWVGHHDLSHHASTVLCMGALFDQALTEPPSNHRP